MRPHVDTFLQRVAELFEVVVFTAGTRPYAKKILDSLDPNNELIQYVDRSHRITEILLLIQLLVSSIIYSHRLYRPACHNVGRTYVKNLEVLGRDLSTVALVDNSPRVFAYQVHSIEILLLVICH